jgi:WD40 repeat protein
MTTFDPTETHVAKEHKHDSPLISCRFDRSGRFVFFGAQDSKVWRWEWASDQKVEMSGHDSWVRAMAFTPDGATFLTGGYDGRLVWWPATDEQPTAARTIEAHQGWVRSVAVSPDGTLVASAGNDNLVKLWNASDGALVREFLGHERYVYNVAFHPAGKDLVSGDLMGNLVHWEVATGKAVRRFKAEALHKYDTTFKADIGGLRGLVFDQAGKRLAGSGITNVTNAFAGVGNPVIAEFDWETAKETIQHVSKDKLRGAAWSLALHPDGTVIGISGGGGGGFLLFWKADQKEEFYKFKLPNTARDMDLASDGLHLATAHYDRKLRICKMADKDQA